MMMDQFDLDVDVDATFGKQGEALNMEDFEKMLSVGAKA